MSDVSDLTLKSAEKTVASLERIAREIEGEAGAGGEYDDGLEVAAELVRLAIPEVVAVCREAWEQEHKAAARKEFAVQCGNGLYLHPFSTTLKRTEAVTWMEACDNGPCVQQPHRLMVRDLVAISQWEPEVAPPVPSVPSSGLGEQT